ncbi:MAG: hypothetical protein QOI48_1138 [Solirubrobacteraceae bacterium]|nr:hypothetical protein [Solirubrobacteraceae bacterium]
MQVSEGMSSLVLTIGPGHTLRDAARAMAERKVGAAIVLDPEQPGPGIVTERDLLDSIGAGQSPDTELVADHLSANLTFATCVRKLVSPTSANARWSWRRLVARRRATSSSSIGCAYSCSMISSASSYSVRRRATVPVLIVMDRIRGSAHTR